MRMWECDQCGKDIPDDDVYRERRGDKSIESLICEYCSESGVVEVIFTRLPEPE